MPTAETTDIRPTRSAMLTVTEGIDRQRVTAHVSGSVSHDDFNRITRQAYDVISKLTGHPCMSGAFDFIVSRDQFKQVINVAL